MLAPRAKTPQSVVHVHADLEQRHDDSAVGHPPRLLCGRRKEEKKRGSSSQEKRRKKKKTHQKCLENAAKGSEHVFVSQLQTRDRRAPARPLLRVRRAGICIEKGIRPCSEYEEQYTVEGSFTDRVLGVALGGVYRPL
jgi:hypothetical protein